MAMFTLAGIVSAPVLPMLPDHSIDWASLHSYIRWIAEQKPSAIAMNMDASEGPSLEHRRATRSDPRLPQSRRRWTLPAHLGPHQRLDRSRGTPRKFAQGRGRRRVRGVPALPDVPRQSRPRGNDLSLSQGHRRRRRAAARRVPVSEGLGPGLSAGNTGPSCDDSANHRTRRSIVRHDEDGRDDRDREDVAAQNRHHDRQRHVYPRSDVDGL